MSAFVITPTDRTSIAQARDVVRIYGRRADWRGMTAAERSERRDNVAWHLAALMRRVDRAPSAIIGYRRLWEQAHAAAQTAAPDDTAQLGLALIGRWVEDICGHPVVDERAGHEVS
ncbi:MAG TPA: hypothetical protein VNG12_13045 [Acidimicrobiales bacterium]|nr:hypothetical protein [Acidimicrobiales bacterium]